MDVEDRPWRRTTFWPRVVVSTNPPWGWTRNGHRQGNERRQRKRRYLVTMTELERGSVEHFVCSCRVVDLSEDETCESHSHSTTIDPTLSLLSIELVRTDWLLLTDISTLQVYMQLAILEWKHRIVSLTLWTNSVLAVGGCFEELTLALTYETRSSEKRREKEVRWYLVTMVEFGYFALLSRKQ